MPQHPGRFIGASALLLGAWVLTYWFWPASAARISFADGPPLVEDAGVPGPSTVPAPHPVPQAPAPPPAGPRMVQRMEPPRFTEYVVAKGDVSWDVISRKVYGDSKWATAISKANPFVSPDKLKVGKTRLKIPVDPTNIQGKLVWVPEGGDSASSTPPAPQPEAAPQSPKAPTPGPGSSWPTSELTHTVKAGETLSGIAKLYYSAPAGYLKIYEANRDKLSSMDKLKPGMVLRIPSGP